MRRAAFAVAVAGVAAGAVLLALTFDASNSKATQADAVLNALIVWSFVASGVVAWFARPGNRIGLLMMGAGFSWFFSALQGADSSVAFSLGMVMAILPLGFLAHLVLAFPEGLLRSTAERAVVWVAYVLASVLQVVGVLLWEPGPGLPDNAFLVSASDAADGIFQAVNVVGLAVAVAVVVILVRRWRTATAPARRAMAPVVWTGGLAAVCAIVLFAAGALRLDGLVVEARLATYSALVLVPIAFLVGLLHSRFARTSVSRLVLELSGAPAPGKLREALARALGDPSLRVAYWLPEEGGYVDATGRPIELPADGDGSTVMHVEHEGRRIGALVHDTSLADQRELLDSVCATAALALENERLQAQLRARLDELRTSEERLRALIEASPLAIVEVDAAGLVTFWNKAAEDLYGWTAEETIGDEISFIPIEREGETDELRARLLAGERISGVETLRLRKDGSLVDVVVAAAPVHDRNGDVRFMAVSADISKRKRAEEALRHERDFISTLIDSTSCLVVVLDRDGRLVRFNRACERLTGYSAAEVLERPLWDLLIDPAEADAILVALGRVWAGDFPADNENHWILRDGSRRLIAWSNTALLDERGNVEYIVSSGVDITERKRVEEELRASEARFREVANAAPVMIWMADATGTVGFFNQRWYEFTGKPVEQLDSSWWDSVHADDREASVDIWRDTIASGEVYEHEYRLRRADGQYRWVFDRGTPRFVADGQLAGYIGITVDITERKEWEDELRASRARILEAQDIARRRLERNLHDGAQQRLVALALGLRLAQAKALKDPEGTEAMLAAAADELAQAITELRELARGIHPAILSDRGLPAAIEALAGRSPTPVDVDVGLDERLPAPIEAAAYFVVSEALANVAKYAEASLVRVSVSRENGHACVEVADDGRGGADPTAGSGLRGLADRVEALDGRLEVESAPGEGTRIRAEIPLGDVRSDA
jgi:PAS domain S-box-containing protein